MTKTKRNVQWKWLWPTVVYLKNKLIRRHADDSAQFYYYNYFLMSNLVLFYERDIYGVG